MPKENETEKIPFIIITNEWIDKWLSVLNATEFKVYIKLAYHYNHKKGISFPGQQTISESIGVKSNKPVINAIAKLEDLNLIERLKKPPIKGKKGWPSNQYRMLHVDDKGYHRAKRQRSSLKEAIAEKKAIKAFYGDLMHKYNREGEALKETFKRFPDFKEAYYSQEWEKEENFWVLEAFAIFSMSSFNNKYEDLRPFFNYIEKVSEPFYGMGSVWGERIEAVKKDLIAQGEKALEDYVYCCEYVTNNYPEYIPVLKENRELKSKGVKGWDKGVREISEKHSDIEEIMLYFNYGIFKELSDKHGLATREVARLVTEISLGEGGMVGLEFDMDDYVNKIRLPDEKALVTEEEYRLIELNPEDETYRDEETGATVVVSKGFTRAEQRDFKGTLKKIEKAKRKVIDSLVEGVASVLAEVYVDGKIREAEGGYKPAKQYWEDVGDGTKIHKRERGYHPANMGLKDLLKHATYEINNHTAFMRADIDDLFFNESPSLVPIPPITMEEIRAKFETEKERLLAEKKEAKGKAEQDTG